MKILINGGNRFFGKKLASKLLDNDPIKTNILLTKIDINK